MNRYLKHIALGLILTGILALGSVAVAQSPVGSVIRNSAGMQYEFRNGTVDSLTTNTVNTIVQGSSVLVVSKTSDRVTALPGDTIRYTIIAGVVGNMEIPGIQLTDTIPSGLTLVSVSEGTVSANVVQWNVGTLLSNTADTLLVTTVLNDDVPSGTLIVNSCTATDSTGSQTVVTSSSPVTIQANPSLSLVKIASLDTVLSGQMLRYVIRFQNTGNTTLTLVNVVDTISPLLTNVSVSGNAQLVGGVVQYQTDSLRMGEVDSVVVDAQVSSSALATDMIRNTAYARTGQTVEQSASTVSVVRSVPGLSFTKSVSDDTVSYGQTVRYVLHLQNTGNSVLAGVSVSDTISSVLTVLGVSPNAQLSGNVVTYMPDTLNVGDRDSVMIDAQLTSVLAGNQTIQNTAYASSSQTGMMAASAQTHGSVVASFALAKSASSDTIVSGNSVSYTIAFRNTGNTPLLDFVVADTLPFQLTNANVSSNAQLVGNVVSFQVDTLGVNESDSVVVTATVASGRPDGEVFTNTVVAQAANASSTSAASSVTVRNPIDAACRLTVAANPTLLVGNGITRSAIMVLLTDSSGNPKPDGTPITLTTPFGTFLNGQATSTVYTLNGVASESVSVFLQSNQVLDVVVGITATDSTVCSASDSVHLMFYPAAVEGIITDNRNGQPVAGATVEVTSSANVIVGSQVTGADGRYLIPIVTTDDYVVHMLTRDEFGRMAHIHSRIHVDVPGTGGNPPVQNEKCLSGGLYTGTGKQPLFIDGVMVILASSPGGTPVDTAYTDELGIFHFTGFPIGNYTVELRHPQLQGAVAYTSNLDGEHRTNVNIPVPTDLPVLFTKTGPATAALGDTVTYLLTVRNLSVSALTNLFLVDSLAQSMSFVSSANAAYDPQNNRVSWAVGSLDSMATVTIPIQVSFTGLTAPSLVRNAARLVGSGSTEFHAEAFTNVDVPASIRIWKTTSTTQAGGGDSITYSIHLRNTTAVTADSVVVTDDLPVELVYLSSSPIGAFDVANRRVVWNIGAMTAGEERVITLQTSLRSDIAPGQRSFTNVAETRWSGGIASSRFDIASRATVDILVPFLQVTKQALRRIVEIGDIAAYTVKIANVSPTTTAYNVSIVDRIPFGFRYVAGSSIRDSILIGDPTGTTELQWDLIDSLLPNSSVQLTYRLTVGAGAEEGNGINRAFALATLPGGQLAVSGEAEEKVEVRRGVFTERGLVIGKVFYDENENRYQDAGEDGVKGIELMTEDGTRVITGDDGKYSITDLAPGEHVMRVREQSLPKYTALLVGYDQFAGNASSRFVRVPESGIARADFYLKKTTPEPAPLSLSQGVAKLGTINARRTSSPKNIVFVRDEGVAAIKLPGSNFDPGTATLQSAAYATLKAVADLAREFPDQTISIMGHTDSRPINTKQFPSNQALSEARAYAVKQYLIYAHQIDSNRIATIGFGETQPLASNNTKEGRAQNRRVEISLSGSRDPFTRYLKTVDMKVHLNYNGPIRLSRIEVLDLLDSSLQFVEGSGRLGDKPVAPTVNGNELLWQIENPGRSVNATLSYQVQVGIPKGKTAKVTSSSSVMYIAGDSVVSVLEPVKTMNSIASATRAKALNFVLSGVLFDVGKASLKPSALNSLKAAAEVLKTYPQSRAVIEGYTDSKPIKTKEFPSNVALSHARAMSVVEALARDFNIDTARMQTFGWGELKPVTSNATESGRQSNRRVEIKVYKKEYAEETIQEGSADTSKVVSARVEQSAADASLLDTVSTGVRGDRFFFRCVVNRQSDPEGFTTMIVDSLPEGIMLVPNSFAKGRGIDSISISGNMIQAICGAQDSVVEYSFIGELTSQKPAGSIIEHWFEVRRTHPEGLVRTDRVKNIGIRIEQ